METSSLQPVDPIPYLLALLCAEAPLGQPQIGLGLERHDSVSSSQIVQYLQQVFVVGAQHLNQHVEAPRGQHHIDGGLESANLVAQSFDVTLDCEADHCLDGESDRERIGDGHDVEHSRFQQSIDSQSNCGRAEVDPLCQFCIIGAPVDLKGGDDLQVFGVEVNRRRDRPAPRLAMATARLRRRTPETQHPEHRVDTNGSPRRRRDHLCTSRSQA